MKQNDDRRTAQEPPFIAGLLSGEHTASITRRGLLSQGLQGVTLLPLSFLASSLQSAQAMNETRTAHTEAETMAEANIQYLVDWIGISDTVTRVGLLADLRDWQALRACFAESVEVDYTSLNGGHPATMKADALIEGWRTRLSGYVSTQHLLGLPVITITGETATCLVHFQAQHYLPSATAGGKWELGGYYHYTLIRDGKGWKVSKTKMTALWGEGNQSLVEQAHQQFINKSGH